MAAESSQLVDIAAIEESKNFDAALSLQVDAQIIEEEESTVMDEAEEEFNQTNRRPAPFDCIMPDFETALKHIIDAKLKEKKAAFTLSALRASSSLETLQEQHRALRETVKADIMAQQQEVMAFVQDTCRLLESEKGKLNHRQQVL